MPSLLLFLLWTAATSVSFMCGAFLSTLAAELSMRQFRGIPVTPLRPIAVELIAGLVVALSQWWILRRHIPGAMQWMPATMAPWLFALLARWAPPGSELRSPVADSVLSGPLFALALGVSQWLVLRQRVPASAWWIPAATAGWTWAGAIVTSSIVIHTMGSSWVVGDQVYGELGLKGAVAGAVTGLALMWLLRRASGAAAQQPSS